MFFHTKLIHTRLGVTFTKLKNSESGEDRLFLLFDGIPNRTTTQIEEGMSR